MQALAPGLLSTMATACEPKRAMALKRVAIWASQQAWLANVAAGAHIALLLEEDTLLVRDFCEAMTQVFTALPAAWDLVFLGHCAEHLRSISKCTRVGSLAGGAQSLFLARAVLPHCCHAMLVSPRGAAKLRARMSDWNRTYSRQVLASLRGRARDTPTHCTAWKRHHHKQALDGGHDAQIARLVLEGHLAAYTVWPQLALQPWQLQPGSNLAIDTFISDRSLPSKCDGSSKRPVPIKLEDEGRNQPRHTFEYERRPNGGSIDDARRLAERKPLAQLAHGLLPAAKPKDARMSSLAQLARGLLPAAKDTGFMRAVATSNAGDY